jgi:hypothetical protein
MPASLNDQAILSSDSLFINRVRQAFVAASIAITNESITPSTLPLHQKRANYASAVVSNPTLYAPQWAIAVATDANVIADATAAGSVVLTTGNVAAQQALVTDAHINTAASAMYNSFFTST